MDLIDSNYYDQSAMWEQIVGYFWNPHFQSSVVILHSLDVNDDLSRHAECMAIKTAIIGINQNHLPHSQQREYPL